MLALARDANAHFTYILNEVVGSSDGKVRRGHRRMAVWRYGTLDGSMVLRHLMTRLVEACSMVLRHLTVTSHEAARYRSFTLDFVYRAP